MMNVYFISGLGADRRIFKNIVLPPGYVAVHMDWIDFQKKESLQEYAYRMAETYIDFSKPFSLIGLSMGGMVAVEIANKYAPEQTVIISSMGARSQFPLKFKFSSTFKIHHILPVSLAKNISIAKKIFGAFTPEDKILLSQIIKDSDSALVNWSMNAIVNWKNKTLPKNLYHIHGTKDRVLPYRKNAVTHTIADGKHFMVVNRAGEINALLKQILGKKH